MGQMTTKDWLDGIQTGLVKKLTENKDAPERVQSAEVRPELHHSDSGYAQR